MDSLQATRNKVFNAAAFYGNLVAIGIIPCTLFNSVMNGFLGCLTTPSQCRMLYLMLVRATFHLACHINSDYLLAWRDRLLSRRATKLPMGNDMVQRWLIVSDRIVPFICVDQRLVCRSSAMWLMRLLFERKPPCNFLNIPTRQGRNISGM